MAINVPGKLQSAQGTPLFSVFMYPSLPYHPAPQAWHLHILLIAAFTLAGFCTSSSHDQSWSRAMESWEGVWMCIAILTWLFLHSSPTICCWPGMELGASLESWYCSEYSCYHATVVCFFFQQFKLFYSWQVASTSFVAASRLEEKIQEANSVPAVRTEVLWTERFHSRGAFLIHLLSCRTLQFTGGWFAAILWQKEDASRLYHSNNLQDGTLIFWKECILL